MKRLLLLAILASLALPAMAKPELVFGFTSAVKNDAELREEEKAWAPVAEAMSRALGARVTAVGFQKGADLVAKMKRNEVQVALMGGVPALDAVGTANARVFAQVVKIKGGDSYRALMIVHKDSPISSFNDVLNNRGKYTLQLGEPKSTSGTLIPLYYAFNRQKVTPEEVFRKITRGNHETNLMAVASKAVDVATVASDLLEGRFKEDNPKEYQSVKVIWRSEPVKSEPVLYRQDLSPSTRKALERFFYTYGKSDAEKAVLKDARQIMGFIRSSNLQLVQVADIQLFQEQQSLMQDDSIPSEKKTEMYEAIFQKYGDLQKLLQRSSL
jgi:phosphonate transport system substrate-binding protein